MKVLNEFMMNDLIVTQKSSPQKSGNMEWFNVTPVDLQTRSVDMAQGEQKVLLEHEGMIHYLKHAVDGLFHA